MEWLQKSPETTLCGLGALVGLLVMVLGLAFDKDELWKYGMGIVGAAATLIGLLARSQRQHEADKPALKAEVVKAAEQKAEDTVHDITRR